MSEQIEAMIALTQTLTGLLAEDARAFEERRPQDVAARIQDTSRLANQYRQESARLRAHAHLVKAAPEAQRLRLVSATEAFDAVLARHGRALEAAKTVTEGLVRAIAEEVADQRAVPSGYGPSAKPADASAITLNQRA